MCRCVHCTSVSRTLGLPLSSRCVLSKSLLASSLHCSLRITMTDARAHACSRRRSDYSISLHESVPSVVPRPRLALSGKNSSPACALQRPYQTYSVHARLSECWCRKGTMSRSLQGTRRIGFSTPVPLEPVSDHLPLTRRLHTGNSALRRVANHPRMTHMRGGGASDTSSLTVTAISRPARVPCAACEARTSSQALKL